MQKYDISALFQSNLVPSASFCWNIYECSNLTRDWRLQQSFRRLLWKSMGNTKKQMERQFIYMLLMVVKTQVIISIKRWLSKNMFDRTILHPSLIAYRPVMVSWYHMNVSNNQNDCHLGSGHTTRWRCKKSLSLGTNYYLWYK